jgi:hypothetical protein
LASFGHTHPHTASRGPDSCPVVTRLMGPRLRDEIEPVVLQGNHEAMLVDGATD